MSDNQEGRKPDIETGKSSRLYPETGDVVESGPSREEKGSSDSKKAIRVEPLTFVPSASQSGSGEPSTNVVTATIPDPTREGPNPVADDQNIVENKLAWKFTAATVAKSFFRGTTDLVFIPANAKRTTVNGQARLSLCLTINALVVLIHTPVFEDDFEELGRRMKLSSTLREIVQGLRPLTGQGRVKSFFNSVRNANKLRGLVEAIHKAVIEYQTGLEQGIYDRSCRLIGDADRILLHSVHHTAEVRHHRTREDILLRLENIHKDVDRLSRLIPLIDAYFTL